MESSPKTCLTCLCNTDEAHNLNGILLENLTILEILFKIVPPLLENQILTLTQWICIDCLDKLVLAYKFHQQCLESVSCLKQDQQNVCNLTTNMYPFDEIPMDFKEDPDRPFYQGEAEADRISVKQEILENSNDKLSLLKEKYMKKSSLKVDNLKKLRKLKQLKGKFTCLQCAKGFSSFKRLKEHNLKHKNFDKEDVQNNKISLIYKCYQCPKAFEKPTSLAAHCRIHKRKIKTKSAKSDKVKQSLKEEDLEKVDSSIVKDEHETETEEEDSQDDELDHLEEKLFDKTKGKYTTNNNSADSSNEDEEKPNSSKINKLIYACDKCDKVFKRPYCLRRHNRVHAAERPHECKVCTYRFASLNILKIHMFKHKKESGQLDTPTPKGIKCPECPRRCRNQNTLAVHLLEHKRKRKDYPCMVCQHNFTSVKTLTVHIITKHPEVEQLKCDECEKTFVVRAHLEEHIKRHKDQENLICLVCEREFPNNAVLREHMRIHSSENPYLCPKCGKTFSSNSCLHQHMERHLGLKKHQCPECPMRFNCRSDIKKHMSTHLKVKPHVCDTCGARFTRSYSLINHKISHSGLRSFKCNQCSMTFSVRNSMLRHMRTHTGEKPYKCKYCERAYAQSGDLTKHLRTHIGENTYMCEQCPMSFKFYGELKKHKIEHFKKAEAEKANLEQEQQKDAATLTKVKRNYINYFITIMDCITKTCLTCLGTTNEASNLQDTLQDNLKILEIIYKIVPVLLENQELTLPEWICATCLDKLVISYNFQKQCLDAIQNLYKLEENTEDVAKKENFEDIYKQELLQEDNEDSMESFHDNKIQFEEFALDSKPENEEDLEMPFYPNDDKQEDSSQDYLEDNESGESENKLITDSLPPYETASLQCKKCKQIFKTHQGLTSHKTRVHIRKYLYNCKKCYRGFDSQEQYTKHCNRHLGIKAFKCPKCDKVFDANSTLNQHLISHSQETPYLCTICGKSFNRSGSLKQHILRHGNVKPFKCSICSKSFKCLPDQLKHMYIHKKKRNQCNLCGVRLASLTAMATHKLLHTGAKQTQDINTNEALSKANENVGLENVSKEEGSQIEFKQEAKDNELLEQQVHSENDDDTMGSPCEDKQEQDNPLEVNRISNKLENQVKESQCFRIQELNNDRTNSSESNQCKECKRIFKNSHGLSVHYKKKHLKTHLYNCDKCDKGFDAEEFYIKHYNLHLGIKPFKCNQCEKTFENRYCYNQHLITHSEDSQFPCKICGKSFRRKGILKQHHQRAHTGEKPFKCKYCSRTFSLACDMKMHRKRIHKDIQSDESDDEDLWLENPFKELQQQDVTKPKAGEHKPQENESFSNDNGTLITVSDNREVVETQHIREDSFNEILELNKDSNDEVTLLNLNENKEVVEQQEPEEDSLNDILELNKSEIEENLLIELKTPVIKNQCKICKHVFRTSQGLASHRTKAHIKTYQYNCDKCYKGFDSKENYKKHVDRHLGVKAFKCPQCNKAFDSTGTLNQHLICHSNETPHLCTICGKSFNRAGSLKQHTLRHGTEKTFKCSLCPKSFKCLPDQISHMYKHNGRRYVCNICGASLSTSSSLASHKLIHTGERPYKCDQCDKSFNISSNLHVHKRIHTGEKPYSCPYCEKTFRQSNDRNKHATRVHRKEIAEAKAASKVDDNVEQNVSS
ncbi:zinc finger protein 62 homolog [Lucilia sericata]|uniref:zinc finger protein 62 homolog n=1 Tax=Lucilia sericata TaxID=13632 RepID=UPI0018A7EA6E|nr:zinc finger protein 62 homolog [Lucilia sericata]